MGMIKTLRWGNKLIILNGKDPLKYVNLTNGKIYGDIKYEVLVEAAIQQWSNGKVKTVNKVWKPNDLTSINILNIPLNASGTSYIKVKLRETK